MGLMQSAQDHFPDSVAVIPRPRTARTDATVKFWGVRGGIACPDAQTARYGGNTSCVEVRLGDHIVIFDGGTGLRQLGNAILGSASSPVKADIFFTHFHMDHVCGLPFFGPCYIPSSQLRFWSGNSQAKRTTKQALEALMADPLFPVGLDEFKADIKFCDFLAGDTLRPDQEITLRTAPLQHPGGSTGYRLQYGEKSIAYITDTEHRPGELDTNVLSLADGADVMIYDCNYTDEEFPRYVGWGHSTWQQGVRLANESKVKTLVLFHHDPKHNDKLLDQIGVEAEKTRPGTLVGAEGLTLTL
jgi:phosphoribosyl 1,2-cyclic phosphodiesterase